MIRAALFMKVKTGQEEEFKRAWETVAQHAQQAPGIIRQSLLRDPVIAAGFVVTSDWHSREAFHAFERSPAQDKLTAPLRELRESARMVVYEIVAHIEQAPVH